MKCGRALVIGAAAVLAALLPLLSAAPGQAQSKSSRDRGEPRRIFIAPQDVVLEPGGKLVLEALATFDDDSSGRVACHWRLLAQEGQARLAVGKGRTVVSRVEAGVAPAFVVVEAMHQLSDGVILRAQTTVLCSKPVLTAPARVAVGEAGPVEVTLPLLPADRPAQVAVEIIETPDAQVDPKSLALKPRKRGDRETPAPDSTHGARFVRMEDGVFGPVGANYAVRMPLRGGSLQVGIAVPRPGRWVLRGAIMLGEGRATRTLYTDPVVVHAYKIAQVRVLSYAAGPPTRASEQTAGPSGHAIAGPVVLEPPQAVAPVVLGYGPGGEALGIMSRATVRFGRVVEVKGRRFTDTKRLPMGMYYVDGGFPGRPTSGSVVLRPIMLHQFLARGVRDRSLRSSLTLAEPVPVAIVPLPVDSEVRLELNLQGITDACRTAPLKGRSAYLLNDAAIAGASGGRAPEAIATVEAINERECRILALAPGVVRVRSRCRLIDREGGGTSLRLVTEVLVLAHDDVVWCDFDGRPVPDAAGTGAATVRWAVLGAGKVLESGRTASPVFPAGAPFVATGKLVKLQREGGWCWYVPVRRK